jgi:glycosyltransferase involved in cell wall biosynthesis
MTYSPENIPLVSIVVYVYNSEAFIIETLESIKAQTYPKLELIITDDLSKDSTLELVEEWIDINKLRFERTPAGRP